ncbi:hypothetical protein CBR_g39678, partial [Chara braunii]
MFRRLMPRSAPEVTVPLGTLKANALKPRFTVHHGIPPESITMAYEPIQRTLAIGTSDGRIKIFGREGVETMLRSQTAAPCKILEFIINRGKLINVTTQNDVEVWDLSTKAVVASLKWDGEITALAQAIGTPYLYFGDDTGYVRVLQLDEVEGILRPMPYLIPVHITQGGLVRAGAENSPSVVGILPQPDTAHTRLVIGYSNGIIVVWGLRETRVLALRGGTSEQRSKMSQYAAKIAAEAQLDTGSSPSSTEVMSKSGGHSNVGHATLSSVAMAAMFAASMQATLPQGGAGSSGVIVEEEEQELTKICWASDNCALLAAGYGNGDVWIWKLPTQFSGGQSTSGKGGEPAPIVQDAPSVSGQPMRKIRVAAGGPRMPIRSLSWCGAPTGKVSGRLYLLGGEVQGTTQLATVVSLDQVDILGRVVSKRELKWYGPVESVLLTPTPGNVYIPPASSAIVLSGNGIVHVYDEAAMAIAFADSGEGKPGLKAEPFRSVLVSAPVTLMRGWMSMEETLALSMLLQLPRQTEVMGPSYLQTGARWPIVGGSPGTPAFQDSKDGVKASILFTGHKNGVIHVWDVSLPSTSLITTIHPEERDGVIAQAVTCMDFCGVSGLLAVGYEYGVACLYVLSLESRHVCRLTVEADQTCKRELARCESGFQCIGIYKLHKGGIRSIALSTGYGRLAFGDDEGLITIINLSTGALTYYGRVFPNREPTSGVMSIVFAPIPTTMDVGISNAPPAMGTGKKGPRASNPPPDGPTACIYLGATNACMAVVDSTSGLPLGAGVLVPRSFSALLSMYILDSTGAPMSSPCGLQLVNWSQKEAWGTALSSGSGYVGQQTISGSVPGMISRSMMNSSAQPSSGGPARLFYGELTGGSGDGSGSSGSLTGALPEPVFAILCSEDCVRMYTIYNIWHMINETEMLRLSLFDGENTLGLPFSSPEVYDGALAAAAMKAVEIGAVLSGVVQIPAGPTAPEKKKK